MNLLVTGASGLLGARLCQDLAKDWSIIGTFLSRPDCVPKRVPAIPVDIRDAKAVTALFEQVRPDAILHTAAMASLHQCQECPADAEACNIEGTRLLAQCAKRLKVPMVYLSTDMVFDGHRGWYADVEIPSAISVYGATKYAGECAARQEYPDSCILRIPLTYGWSANGREGSIAMLIAALRRGEGVSLFTDEYRTPILIDDLCRSIGLVIAAGVNGIRHLAGPRRLSRYALGVEAAKAFGLAAEGIVPISLGTADSLRPKDCSLIESIGLRDLGCVHRDPTDGLHHMAANESRKGSPLPDM
jgi:dTDP-4-dehydrorhamnose reductase